MTDVSAPEFLRFFKLGFAAAAGAIAAVALALSIVFAVNGLLGAHADRRSEAELDQMRAEWAAALDELRRRDADQSNQDAR